jgi:hypothetical protein
VNRPQQLPARVRTIVAAAIIAAILLRLVLAWISIGTNDARNWRRIATEVSEQGFLQAYRNDSEINHPPLAVLYARMTLLGNSPRNIALLMKLPAIAGDALAVWLLAKVWAQRKDPRRAILASLSMALSPVAILISAYHCNTDNLYAFLSLLAMYLISDRRRFFLAGLALGGAINVKLIPVILLPATYSLCRSWRDALRLTAGLAVCAIPFAPLVILAPDAVRKNMLSYAPPVSEWGIAMILHTLHGNPELRRTAYEAMLSYLTAGRWLILLCVGILSVKSFISRCWNGYELGAISYALLLLLAPGFGPQYTVIIVPLLLAVTIAGSWVWSITVGLYIGFAYFSRLISSGIPMETAFIPGTPTPPGAGFGFIGWMCLGLTTLLLLVRRRRVDADHGLGS